MALQITWFILLFVLLAGYAVLDGFDLGVGILHLTGRTDNERRLGLQAIGPIWDGNEVWLLTGGGALFAAFPFVYATVFSTMYLALYLVLAALIGRATAIEFRSKETSPAWRKVWDIIFFVGSLLPSVLFGVAFGNVIRGLPIEPVNGQLQFTGNFFTLLNPFSICVGVLSTLLFLTQGAIFLAMKSAGRQQDRMRTLIPVFWMLAVVVYVGLTIFGMLQLGHLFDHITGTALYWLLMALVILSAIAVPILVYSRKFASALVASSAMIVSMMALAALGLFPRLVISSTSLANSLTIEAHSSSQLTLKTMLIIALAGMPLVLGYTFWIYSVFRGKTVVNPEGY